MKCFFCGKLEPEACAVHGVRSKNEMRFFKCSYGDVVVVCVGNCKDTLDDIVETLRGLEPPIIGPIRYYGYPDILNCVIK